MTIVAVDAGTSAIKAAVITDEGEVIAVAREPVAGRGSVGNDPETYWQHVAKTIRGIAAEAQDADAIAVTGQGDGLWTVDDRGQPAGPAYEWNATVAAEVIRGWEADGTIGRHYGHGATVLWPGTSAALWKWLQVADTEHAGRTRHVFCAKDWVNFKLGGEIATDVTDATIPFLDLVTGGYSTAAMAELGCLDLGDKLAPIRGQGERLGTLSAEAANVTGLPVGLPILMGCLDVVSLTRGVGLERTGDALVVLGTTAAAMVLTEEVDRLGEQVGATLRLQEGGSHLRVMGSSSGTSTLDWYRKTSDLDLEQFWTEVGDGVSGVTMLPYLAGERVPFLAPDATGGFFGLTPATSRADLSRAVAHGITHSLRHCLDAAGCSERPLVLTGGGSASEQWCQLVADITQRQVEVDARNHVACVGLAQIVTGQGTAQAIDRSVYVPQTDLTAEYELFVDLGQRLRPIWADFASADRLGEP